MAVLTRFRKGGHLTSKVLGKGPVRVATTSHAGDVSIQVDVSREDVVTTHDISLTRKEAQDLIRVLTERIS